jgi:hypothetical protein
MVALLDFFGIQPSRTRKTEDGEKISHAGSRELFDF